MPEISVIIRTRNPRKEYLERALAALKEQSLPKDQWELLLIDNASTPPLQGWVDVSWHPQSRIVRQEEAGATVALLEGIQESGGDLIVIVDDDNVLDRQYLELALELAAKWPQLGAFGGSIEGEFEITPPTWITPYIEGLAVCKIQRDYWSNICGWSLATPYGAGMCVRRDVANDYLQKAKARPLRTKFAGIKTNMLTGEDGDLAWCATDVGMGTGRFCALRMTHLIAKYRLTEEWVVRLYAGFAGSREILAVLRDDPCLPKSPWWRRTIRFLFDYATGSRIQRRILLESRKSRREAKRLISSNTG